MNKYQLCRTSKKDGKLLRDIFFNKWSFRRFNPRIMCLFVNIPLSHGSAILSTNQRSACVAWTCRHPFRRLSTPNEGVLRDEYDSIRLSLGHAHFWRWKHDPCRTFANWTDPGEMLHKRPSFWATPVPERTLGAFILKYCLFYVGEHELSGLQ